MAGTISYRCPICGIEKKEVNRWQLVWLMAASGTREFSVRDWTEETAREDPDVLTVCGQAHVHRLLDSFFTPPATPETTEAEQCSSALEASAAPEPTPGAPLLTEPAADSPDTSEPCEPLRLRICEAAPESPAPAPEPQPLPEHQGEVADPPAGPLPETGADRT